MKKRISKVISVLNGDQAYYISDPSDVFYLSGYRGTFGKIICRHKRAYFVTDPRYKGLVEKLGLSGTFEVIITKNFRQDLRIIFKGAPETLLNKNTLLADYLLVKELSLNVVFDNTVRDLRMIKDPAEINLIKKAVSINEKAIQHIQSLLKPGISENDLSAEFEYYIRKEGADSQSFPPIIAFNENAAVPHHGTSQSKLKNNTLVLIDSGVRYKGYCSDLTRVMAFGIIGARLKDIQKQYKSVQNAKKAGVGCYKDGVIIKEADRQAREYLGGLGLDRYFTHSLGHSIGIDVHEPPGVSQKEELKFEPGMVFSCEPGVYFDGKYGIRIEDDYLITDTAPIKLGKLSDSLIIV
jgi:Xaa-Pro aminopeptidase